MFRTHPTSINDYFIEPGSDTHVHQGVNIALALIGAIAMLVFISSSGGANF
jgi:hypothetical protein